MAELGLIEPGLRLPLTSLSESLRPRVRAALDQALGSHLLQAKSA
jgi:hypothetical protein